MPPYYQLKSWHYLDTDASLTGWGITNGIYPSWSLWHKAELDQVNVLELKAIETGLIHTVKTKYPDMSDLCVIM